MTPKIKFLKESYMKLNWNNFPEKLGRGWVEGGEFPNRKPSMGKVEEYGYFLESHNNKYRLNKEKNWDKEDMFQHAVLSAIVR